MAGLLDIFAGFEAQRREYRKQFEGITSATPPPQADNSVWSPQLPVSLFYRVYGKPYTVGDIQLDLVLSEAHSLTSTVSEHPVEEGATISDHIQQNLRVGRLRGLVSNYSIQPGGGDGVTNRAMSAWVLFQNLWRRRELVTLVTALDVYEDVAVTSVSTERDDRTGDCLEFDVSFQQIKQPRLAEVTLSATLQPPDMSTAQRRQAASKVRNGRVAGKDATMDLGETVLVGRTTP